MQYVNQISQKFEKSILPVGVELVFLLLSPGFMNFYLFLYLLVVPEITSSITPDMFHFHFLDHKDSHLIIVYEG